MNALSILFGVLLFTTALFLILLVLVQRGRGGGLSGALGGMGGQSAFGTKAGDLFTRITIVVATFWILLCVAAILLLNRQSAVASRPNGEGVEYTTPALEPGGVQPEADTAGGGVTGGGAVDGAPSGGAPGGAPGGGEDSK